MAQELNSARVTHLASELAAVTGEDMETAVVSALEERLARLARPEPIEAGDEIDALFERLARMPVRDRLRRERAARLMVIDTSAIFCSHCQRAGWRRLPQGDQNSTPQANLLRHSSRNTNRAVFAIRG